MMTTAHAVIASGILTLLMLLVASAYCTKAWTPPGMQVAFGNRENVSPPVDVAGRADRAAKNMLEGMVLLLAVVLAAQLAGKGAQAATGASVTAWRTCYGRSRTPILTCRGSGSCTPIRATSPRRSST